MPEDCDSSVSQQPSAPADIGNAAEKSWLAIDLVEDAGDWSAYGTADDHVSAAALALSRHPRFEKHSKAQACIALSDDESVRALNAQYRGIDKATNVLSFPSGAGPRDGVIALGDVVMAVETVSREAEEQNVQAVHHLQHLVVHGLLHLLGFDHETEAEAFEMETIETDVLASLGIANPYAEPPEASV